MIEGFLICRLIIILGCCLSLGFGIAALVSFMKFYNEKMAKIFLIVAAVLLGIGLLAVIPMCIIYCSFELQFLEYIGFI